VQDAGSLTKERFAVTELARSGTAGPSVNLAPGLLMSAIAAHASERRSPIVLLYEIPRT
jgi:hypothetical protein